MPKPGASRTAGPALRESLVAEAVIGRTALGIRQGLVGLVEFLEAQFGFRIARIAIGVILHRQLAKGALQHLLVSVPFDTEDFISNHVST